MVKDLSIVIPCLNEEKTIGLCIEKCIKVFETNNINGEIIISDNGSSDDSVNIAKSFGNIVQVINCKEKGYGNALKYGFECANGKYILFADADNTYDFFEIPKFMNSLSNNPDMVIGTRLKGNIHKGAMPFLHRYLGTPILTFILNCLFKTKISDSQCGMRLIKRASLENISFKTTGMEFASEMLVEFAKHKLKIVEIPISLHKGEENRVPHLNPWSDGCRHLKYLIIEYLNKLLTN